MRVETDLGSANGELQVVNSDSGNIRLSVPLFFFCYTCIVGFILPRNHDAKSNLLTSF